VHRLANNGDVVAFKMGRLQGARRAHICAYLNRYVTDEQRGRRPIFNATLRAGASWLFFRVARSTRMTQIGALYRQSGSDRALKNSQLTAGDVTIICETVHSEAFATSRLPRALIRSSTTRQQPLLD
jgi:hypothetical protein